MCMCFHIISRNHAHCHEKREAAKSLTAEDALREIMHANIDGQHFSSKAKYMICSTELGNSSPAVHTIAATVPRHCSIAVALFPGSQYQNREGGRRGWRAWYPFLYDRDIIETGPEFPEHKK